MHEFSELERMESKKMKLKNGMIKILFSTIDGKEQAVNIFHDENDFAAFSIQRNEIIEMKLHNGKTFFSKISGEQLSNVAKILEKMPFKNAYLQKKRK